MCTCLTLNDQKFYFGRNLDLEYNFGQKVVITPRNYAITYKQQATMHTHYAMIGMASVYENYPLYAEAVNEKGLGMAGLNFPGNAVYKQADPSKDNITPYEFIPWILGQCSTVAQARALVEKINLLAIPFLPQLPLAPLHWMIADKDQAIIVEAMADGLHIYDNPYGVLTNNPPFNYYLMHMHNYLNVQPSNPENNFGKDLPLAPYGQGFGGIGLPGDFSPASRFVKAAYLRANSYPSNNEDEQIAQFFHILDGVAMVKGSVITPEGKPDITIYSCCIDAEQGIYYYKTYENSQINAIAMHRVDLESNNLYCYELKLTASYNYQN
ncbi:MAG: choloylglycine hydrolase [Erysipelotrichaceae bacterium]|nr:choloylglycine hydrolase [Erysipelotrichaceae bacterium]MDY5251141.1 choloylglycine hydrolase [Erysipelotrichaceae bacterium]